MPTRGRLITYKPYGPGSLLTAFRTSVFFADGRRARASQGRCANDSYLHHVTVHAEAS